MSEALRRNARREQVASQGISRVKAMTAQEQRNNSVCCNFALAKQFVLAANRGQQVNDKKIPLRPDDIVNVGKVTYELARNIGRGSGPETRFT